MQCTTATDLDQRPGIAHGMAPYGFYSTPFPSPHASLAGDPIKTIARHGVPCASASSLQLSTTPPSMKESISRVVLSQIF